MDLLDRNQDVFFFETRQTLDAATFFVENEIGLEELQVPHREGARRMTRNNSDACRKAIETLLEYDMIGPSKSQ